MADNGEGPNWIPWDVRRWLLGTQFLSPITEYVYFRLCMTAYERDNPTLQNSPRMLLTITKNVVTIDEIYVALRELEEDDAKVKVTDDEIHIKSVEKRLREVHTKQRRAKQRTAAATASRKKKAEERRAQEAENKEETDVTVTVTSDITEQNTTEQNITEENLLSSAEPSDEIDYDAIVARWNSTADRFGLPRVKELTSQRRAKIKARLKTHSVEDLYAAMAEPEHCPHLRGENDRGWRMNFDFILEPAKLTKLLEGNYRGSARRSGSAFDAMRDLYGPLEDA